MPVDLAELADILEGDPIHGGGLLDLRTGQVWPQTAIDYAADSGEQNRTRRERVIAIRDGPGLL